MQRGQDDDSWDFLAGDLLQLGAIDEKRRLEDVRSENGTLSAASELLSLLSTGDVNPTVFSQSLGLKDASIATDRDRLRMLQFLVTEVHLKQMARRSTRHEEEVKSTAENGLDREIRTVSKILGIPQTDDVRKLLDCCADELEKEGSEKWKSQPILDPKESKTSTNTHHVSAEVERINSEYLSRGEHLLKRFHATLETFLGPPRKRKRQNPVSELIERTRSEVSAVAHVSTYEVLAATKDSLQVRRPPKKNGASSRASVRQFSMPEVPDRGGRHGFHEQKQTSNPNC